MCHSLLQNKGLPIYGLIIILLSCCVLSWAQSPTYQDNIAYLQAFEKLYVESDFGTALAKASVEKQQYARDDLSFWAFQLLEASALFNQGKTATATSLLQEGVTHLQAKNKTHTSSEIRALLADYHLELGLISAEKQQDEVAMEKHFSLAASLTAKDRHFRECIMEASRALFHYHLGRLDEYRAEMMRSFALAEIACLSTLYHPFPTAYQQLDRKRKIIHSSKALSDIGYLLEIELQYNTADFFYRKGYELLLSVEPVNTEKLIYSLFNQAYFNYSQGNYEQAEEWCKDILEINQKKSYQDKSLESGVFLLLGEIHHKLGDTETAQRYYLTALQLSQQATERMESDEHYIYSSLAQLHYEKGTPKKAIEYIQMALKKCPASDTKNMVDHQILLAQSYALVDKKKAKKLYKNILPQLNKMDASAASNELRQQAYLGLGSLEKEKAASMKWYQKSYQIYQRDSIKGVVACATFRAMANWHKADTTTYQQYMNMAIESTLRGTYQEGKALQQETIHHHLELLATLQQLGDYYQRNAPLRALDYWQQAAQVSEWAKPLYRYENSRLKLVQASIPIYKSILAQWADLYLASGSAKHFQEAFQAAELSQSMLLKYALTEYKAVGSAGIPDTLFRKGKELRQDLLLSRQYFKEYGLELSPNEKEKWNQKIVQASIAYEQFQLQLKEKYPKYYALKYAPQSIAVAEIQAALQPGTQLLEYNIQGNTLYIFSITNDHTELFVTSLEEGQIEQLVQKISTSIQSPNNPAWKQSSHELYQLLLADILQPSSQQLVIVPDHILHYVPFNVLMKPEERTTPIAIQYAYTALQVQAPTTHKNQGEWLGIAPAYLGATWANLPFAQAESKEIFDIWKGKNLVGADATLAAFQAEMKQPHSMVHIAGHAEANLEEPLMSKLVLATNTKDEASSYLYAYQLYNMNIEADLVTLSACNTGYGSIMKGEGVMSLARGFAYAGCPATVTTLWSVDDQSTHKIMVQFYKNLKKGMNKAQALRHAQQWFVENSPPKFHHPYYWAGIVLIGSDVPIQQNNGFFHNRIWVVLLLLGAITSIGIKQFL